jgi:hypothetical protein
LEAPAKFGVTYGGTYGRTAMMNAVKAALHSQPTLPSEPRTAERYFRGSVQRAADQIRIRLHDIDLDTQQVCAGWSFTFSTSTGDEKIAATIADIVAAPSHVGTETIQ